MKRYLCIFFGHNWKIYKTGTLSMFGDNVKVKFYKCDRCNKEKLV